MGGTRVTLESLIYTFREGATPEGIVESFPSLDLSDVYVIIAFYLKHREAVDACIEENERVGDEIRHEIERKHPTRDLRERLLASRRSQSSTP